MAGPSDCNLTVNPEHTRLTVVSLSLDNNRPAAQAVPALAEEGVSAEEVLAVAVLEAFEKVSEERPCG